jgi:DNA topoisomerase-3
MTKTLIVAEKPSVAKDIAAALQVPKFAQYYESAEIIVSSCVGHLVEIFCAEADADRRKVPVIPAEFGLRVAPSRGDQFELVKKLMHRADVDHVVNACDAGREGEAIFRLTAELAHCTQLTSRMWLQTMTKQGIIKAWENRVDSAQYDHLGHAARSRSESDWLIGINGSRVCRVAVGRVMTPTLAMVVKAYLDHKNFVPTSYWEVFGHFKLDSGSYTAKWLPRQSERSNSSIDESDTLHEKAPTQDGSRFFDQRQARALLNKLGDAQPSSITDQSQKVLAHPPPLFDLTTLQCEANKQFKFSAAKTLEIAQALYEKHKVASYPRTDSQALPEDYVDKCVRVVALLGRAYPKFAVHAERIGQQHWVVPNKQIFNNDKISDHFAIIPTGAISNALSRDEQLVYHLICQRFLAVFHPPAEYDKTVRTTIAAGEVFRVTGKVLVSAGWKAVYASDAGVDEPDKGAKDAEPSLPILVPGELGQTLGFDVKGAKTKAPALLTESSLLRAMETAGKTIEEGDNADALKERGIGTPATRAATIEKLKDTRGFNGVKKEPFITLDKNNLIPTSKGLAVIDYLNRTYPMLTSASLTGQWEYQLKMMEKGALGRTEFMDAMRSSVLKMVAQIQKSAPNWSSFAGSAAGQGAGHAAAAGIESISGFGACPLCKKEMVDRKVCLACRCGFTLWKTIAGKQLPQLNIDQIITVGETEPISGFKNKAGKLFTAKLKVDESSRAVLFHFN